MSDISKLLIGIYEIPLVSDDYRFSLYRYGKDDINDIRHSKYLDLLPGHIQSDTSPLEDLPSYCIGLEDEYVILINSEDASPFGMVCSLMRSLYHAVTEVSELLDSEEFGARVMGEAFEKFAPLLDPSLLSAEKSSVRGMSVSEIALPLYGDGYKVTLNMYDNIKGFSELIKKIRDVYVEKILSGEFNPSHVHGFTAEPSCDELGIFLNNESKESLLKQEKVLAHELFHAVRKIIKAFDDSTELGGRIYLLLFKKFAEAITPSKDKEE